MDPHQIPTPCSGLRIENQQLLLCQRFEKLNRKERVPSGLFVNQLCKRLGILAMQRIHNQPINVVARQWAKRDFLYRSPCPFQLLQQLQKWMERPDFVVPISAD